MMTDVDSQLLNGTKRSPPAAKLQENLKSGSLPSQTPQLNMPRQAPVAANGDHWSILINHCLSRGLGVIPSVGGEPWLDLEAIESFTGIAKRTIQKKLSEFGIQRHPLFSGYVRLSEFENVVSEKA